MPLNILEISRNILNLNTDLERGENNFKTILNNVEILKNKLRNKEIDEKNYNIVLNNYLKNNNLNSFISNYKKYKLETLNEIKILNNKLFNEIEIKTKEFQNQFTTKKSSKSSQKLPSDISKEDIARFLEFQKKKTRGEKKISADYSVYSSNNYARISNQFADKLAYYLINKYPEVFKPLFNSVRGADIKLISSTYLSILIFTTIISLPILTLIFFLITLSLSKAIILGFLGMISTAFIVYAYPLSVISSRRRKIKSDLVFATVHMAAISGSGVHPVKIFKLLLESGEYKYLESEFKKILNYINLFGYSLSTSLRSVAADSPSYELKELLNGMVATIETGGELKKYLQDKAEDALNQYKGDQKKRLDVLNTYSDIYTGILVAAPLLFLVTLAILDKISPSIGGISITTIASVGTFIGIPVINIVFILLINVTQPEIWNLNLKPNI